MLRKNYVKLFIFVFIAVISLLFTIQCGDEITGITTTTPSTNGSPKGTAGLDYVENEVIIRVFQDRNPTQIGREIGGIYSGRIVEFEGCSYLKYDTGNTRVDLFIEQNLDHSDILSIQPNILYQKESIPNDHYYKEYQFSMDQLNIEKAWDITTGRKDVLLTFMDTGLNATHPDFESNVLPGKAYYGLKGSGHDINRLVNPAITIDAIYDSDNVGHGTQVASIAAAKGNNTVGIAGVAWNASINIHQIFPATGNAQTDAIVRAIVDTADYVDSFVGTQEIKKVVANMSIGSRFYDNAQVDAINYALRKGVVLVSSAGNSPNTVLQYPAAYPGVIAVGAIDSNGNRAPFSPEGYFLSVVAPGTSVWSIIGTEDDHDSYIYGNGTSFSTPFVSGLAALILSAGLDNNLDLSPMEVRSIIELSATDIGLPGFDSIYGYGKIDCEKAVDMAQNWSKSQNLYGNLRVLVKDGDQHLNNISVYLKNESGDILALTTSIIDSDLNVPDGAYFFNIRANKTYKVEASYKGHSSNKLPVEKTIAIVPSTDPTKPQTLEIDFGVSN